MRPSCRLGLTTTITTMLLATTTTAATAASALTRRAAHRGRPLLPAICGFQHAAAAASRLSSPPLPLRPLATATAAVGRVCMWVCHLCMYEPPTHLNQTLITT